MAKMMFLSKVSDVTPQMKVSVLSGVGKDAVLTENQTGWIYKIGLLSLITDDFFAFTKGEQVKITIETYTPPTEKPDDQSRTPIADAGPNTSSAPSGPNPKR